MLRSLVLVVDDDKDTAELMEAALEGAGFSVRVASSCGEARAVMESASVDALVTDLSLGDGDAIDLLGSLGDRRPRVAVVVSGHGSKEDQARSRAAGFHEHFVKPVELGALARLLLASL